MKRIWKFPLQIEDEQEVQMPSGAHILCVQMSNGTPCLWAEVDPYTIERQNVRILIRGTGHNFSGDEGRYIGTVQMNDGVLVWHVYDSN